MGRAHTPIVNVVVSCDTLALYRAGICSVRGRQQAMGASIAAAASTSVHVERHKGLVRDMGVNSRAAKAGGVEGGYVFCKGMEMGSMGSESVRSSARDPNLIIPAILESSSLL
jgi:hypothetical protein